MDEPKVGRLLVVVVVVVAALLVTKQWLADGPPDEGAGVPGLGPDAFVFAPREGRWLQEVVVEGGEHVLVPVDVTRGDEPGTWALESPWRPPEPDVFGLPPWIVDHAPHIRVRVTVAETGHVGDVVGPDDYFDRLDETDPAAADALRALKIEEQIDQVLRWQLTAVMSQSSLAGSTWGAEAAFPGLGTLPSWRGMVLYSVGPEQPCPPPAGDEACAPVMFTADGLSGTMVFGRTTGMEWSAELERTHEGTTRRVRRRLLRPEDAPPSP